MIALITGLCGQEIEKDFLPVLFYWITSVERIGQLCREKKKEKWVDKIKTNTYTWV